MKAQVANFLTKTAEHHVAMAKAHQAAMEACEEGAPEHEFHKVALAAHAGMGEECVGACKALAAATKGMLSGFDGDLDSIEPLNVSRIAPAAPRAIPRHGAPPVREATGDGDGMLISKVFGFDSAEEES